MRTTRPASDPSGTCSYHVESRTAVHDVGSIAAQGRATTSPRRVRWPALEHPIRMASQRRRLPIEPAGLSWVGPSAAGQCIVHLALLGGVRLPQLALIGRARRADNADALLLDTLHDNLARALSDMCGVPALRAWPHLRAYLDSHKKRRPTLTVRHTVFTLALVFGRDPRAVPAAAIFGAHEIPKAPAISETSSLPITRIRG